MRYSFDPDKALEAILFIAPKVNNDLYTTMKLIYLADKLHLERYGCLIFGDRYARMPYGPTPSSAFDIVKYVRGEGTTFEYPLANEAFHVDGNSIIPIRDADTGELSRSDLRCLSESIEKYGHLSFGELKNLVHDDAYHATQDEHFIRLETIAATLPNAAELIQHLADPNPGSD